MSEKLYASGVVILYSILILVSLGDPAMILTIGRFLSSANLDLFLSLFPYGVVSAFLVYLTFTVKETRPQRFLFLIVMSIILFFIERYLRGEREKLHLIEFALLGGLILWSATIWKFKRYAAYFFVLMAGPIIVGLDELFQVSLSVKVFSVRDILVNVMAVALGSVMYGGLFLNSAGDEEEKEEKEVEIPS